MVPTQTGKPGKMGEHFSVGILLRLEKSGNFAQNTGKSEKIYCKIGKKKYWKSQGNLSAGNSENPVNMGPYFK